MMNQIRNPNDEIILRRGDCFDHLADLPDRSIRAVIMDPPYGTMKAKWDRKLDLAKFWASIEPKLLPNAIVASFAAGKFLFELQRSNPQQYRYDLIWRKDRGAGFLNSGFRPLISHEMILIFAAKISRSVFNPQNTACEFRPRGIQLKRTASRRSTLYGRESRETTWIDDGRRHPTSVLDFACCRAQPPLRRWSRAGDSGDARRTGNSTPPPRGEFVNPPRRPGRRHDLRPHRPRLATFLRRSSRLSRPGPDGAAAGFLRALQCGHELASIAD
jgi:hypothetical protein